jgi:hypothetical protein
MELCFHMLRTQLYLDSHCLPRNRGAFIVDKVARCFFPSGLLDLQIAVSIISWEDLIAKDLPARKLQRRFPFQLRKLLPSQLPMQLHCRGPS